MLPWAREWGLASPRGLPRSGPGSPGGGMGQNECCLRAWSLSARSLLHNPGRRSASLSLHVSLIQLLPPTCMQISPESHKSYLERERERESKHKS